MSNQKMIIALLGVVAVLLAVVVGVLVFKPATVPPVDTTATGATANPGSTTGNNNGIPTTDPNAPFDPAKATAASGTPKDHVSAYFGAIVKGDYNKAFNLLPTDKKANGEQAFADQIKGYGMSSFKIDKVDEKGDTSVVNATVQTSGGPFTYIWTFVKYNGKWVVKSRAIGGMGQ